MKTYYKFYEGYIRLVRLEENIYLLLQLHVDNLKKAPVSVSQFVDTAKCGVLKALLVTRAIFCCMNPCRQLEMYTSFRF